MNVSRRNFMKSVGLGAAATGLAGYAQSTPRAAWAQSGRRPGRL